MRRSIAIIACGLLAVMRAARADDLAVPERPLVTVIQLAISKMQEQKRALREQESSVEDVRTQARGMSDYAKTIRKEFLQSLADARLKAKEQARKLAEEAKTSGRRGR